MRRLWIWLTAGLLTASTLHAELGHPLYNFEVSSGYRHDNFKWYISGGSNSPEVLWKQEWHELQMVSVSSNFNYTTCNNYYTKLTADYGHIYDGDCRNSRYKIITFPESRCHRLRNHRHKHKKHKRNPCHERREHEGHKLIEFTRIKGEAEGHAMDFSAMVGYQFTSNGRRCVITPYGGWAQHYQMLKMVDAEQVINRDKLKPHPKGPITGLVAHYNPRWYGPTIGFEWLVQVEVPCVSFLALWTINGPNIVQKGVGTLTIFSICTSYKKQMDTVLWLPWVQITSLDAAGMQA